MARRKQSVPSYLLHKPTGQARVRINGTDVYLGRYDSPESRAEYARVIAELAVCPIPDAPEAARPTRRDVTVNELLLGFWGYAEGHYRRADGTPTNELPQFRQTFRLVRELYGHTPAHEFGPLALKAIRQKMIEAGWNRKLVNQRVGRVRRAFRWAVENELFPPAVLQALKAVAGLQAGRTAAREADPVLPVADADVRTTLPFLGPVVRGMVEVQLLTGMRPGEVRQLRPCDIDTAGEVWVFRLRQFKTRHRGKARAVAIGPRGGRCWSCSPRPSQRATTSTRGERWQSSGRRGRRAGRPRGTLRTWPGTRPCGWRPRSACLRSGTRSAATDTRWLAR
jgi:integrase